MADWKDLDHPGARYGARLGQTVASLRKSQGERLCGKTMSRRGLAKAAHLSPGTIGKLEAGKIQKPSLRLLLALRAGLQLGTLEELLGPLPSHTYQEEIEGPPLND